MAEHEYRNAKSAAVVQNASHQRFEMEYARQNDLTVVAICPFVKEYVGSHPEYQSFVTTSVA
jgi:hypothetical protein